MSTTLTVGLVSFAAATTFIVWDPVGEPTAPREVTAARPLAEVPELEPALVPAAAAAVQEDAAAEPALARTPVEGQDQDEKIEKQEWTTEFFHTVAQLATTESVMLNTGSGDIKIVAAQDGNVSFDAKVVADLERVEQSALTYVLEDHVKITEEDGSLKIEDAHAERRDRGWSVDFVLYLPQELALHANTGSGDVTVTQVTSKLMVNTGSGDVKIASPGNVTAEKLMANTGSGDVQIDIGGVSKSLGANTGSGDVHARLRNYDSPGKLSLNSGSGDLSLGVPANVGGDFDLETHSGSIHLPAALGLLVEEGKGTTFARGMVGSGGGVIRLGSGSGDIEVHFNDKTRVGPQ